MNKQDKQLLLKNLCGRLPYKCKVYNSLLHITETLDCVNLVENTINGYYSWEDTIKPYLRPMSSMTKEEKEQTRDLWIGADTKTHATRLIDFYNKHHIDYRGLIEKGLAIEAPKGMYK